MEQPIRCGLAGGMVSLLSIKAGAARLGQRPSGAAVEQGGGNFSLNFGPETDFIFYYVIDRECSLGGTVGTMGLKS